MHSPLSTQGFVGMVAAVTVWTAMTTVDVADAAPPTSVFGNVHARATASLEEDYPHLCVDRQGVAWLVYVEWDGKQDVLKLAKQTRDGIKDVASLNKPGVVLQPRLTRDGGDGLIAVWSELDPTSGVYRLLARHIQDGKPTGDIAVLTAQGNNIFADAGTSPAGKVWVAWQRFDGQLSDIHAGVIDVNAMRFAKETRVTKDSAGDWEPRLAFGKDGHAVIAYDSSSGGDFNVMLAKVSADGEVALHQVTDSPLYEARVSIASTPNGDGYWLAWEEGKARWGGDWRTHNANIGLNANKRAVVAYIDGKTMKRTAVAPPFKPVIADALAEAQRKAAEAAAAKATKAGKKPKKLTPQEAIRRNARRGGGISMNLPTVAVDDKGRPWLFCRYARNNGVWSIATGRLDRGADGKWSWSRARTLPQSSFSQERQLHAQRGPKGGLIATWPADLRTTKKPKPTGVYLTSIHIDAELGKPTALAVQGKFPDATRNDPAAKTPERPRAQRHTWTFNGKTYSLYYGDFHRHTNLSNCRTIADGSINEQFRYAVDIGALDFLGTSDHTDIVKAYTAYEWWQNQKLADVYHNPGFFNSFYVYEREQRWPWGHRNVVFAERGGPIVYINRGTYRNSPWQKAWPVKEGKGQITPMELWDVLKRSGKRVTVLSHTGATGMGTNWELYEQIDNSIETVVEIYQSARVSYEGLNCPQPTVATNAKMPASGLNATGKVIGSFGQHNKGVYQNALKSGHKLGVFASSDHISTHTAFGGVFAEEFTRDGLLDGIDARRTIAATDKIFLHFSCSGQPMGAIFKTSENPTFEVFIDGTAPIARVTLVRNETDHRVFTPKGKKRVELRFTDDKPIAGENRYYLRVEQADGNMAWASPVWVTYGQAAK